MKEYTSRHKIKAIQWTGHNTRKIKNTLGEGFIVKETNTNSLNIMVNKKGYQDRVYLEILKDSWAILDKYGWGLRVILNEVFQKNLLK